MGGATSVLPVIRDAFSHHAADNTQWADTIDWTVRCDWLQVASSRIILYMQNTLLMYVQVLWNLLRVISYIVMGEGGRFRTKQNRVK